MSILIKGIHIDLNAIKICGDCPFCYDYMYCLATDKTFCEHNIDCVDEKADWCPLVALPEHHGRLIDADALEADTDYEDGDYYGFSIRQIVDAPTIIEAEGNE